MFWLFILNQTMNRDFLILLQWYIVWTDPDLNTFLPAEDALPKTRRLLNTWETVFATKSSQCSGHLYWINHEL